ncbi:MULTISPECIES: ATP-grasp domain-containing protein [Niastella]|uniref:ATP-grasp domain-containing protein n=1 Tax=Niastella soli TaxID=2821487 RepID=A0ABS3Z2D6_9BACT|nr:ATP-grasp domain-containing protein [Niastella soli]MBO9204332.1 ATP-grasp domain-containing protein [Niastella soli]
MNILFCDNPFDNKPTVETDYEVEFISAKQNGFTTQLFSYESLTKDKDAEYATRRIKHSNTLQKIIYRGWMLKPNQYTLLYNTLLTKNFQLINSPTEYQNCHYLPDSYKFISAYTPKTTWLTVENAQVNYDEVFKNIAIFGNSPLIVKDFVKSQKHYWDTACFIPSATEKNNVISVVQKFVALQNTDLNEGLVFREFIELNDLTTHSKSGMPLKQEYRLFFLNKQLLNCYNYWEEGEYSTDEHPPLDLFMGIAKNIESNFFSMDIAKTNQGKWVVIELGDGQVAGLPDKGDPLEFYELIRQHC